MIWKVFKSSNGSQVTMATKFWWQIKVPMATNVPMPTKVSKVAKVPMATKIHFEIFAHM